MLLGPVLFLNQEVPDTVTAGGKQMLAIHREIGGYRVIDAMGPDPAPIEWSGLFLGTNASVRARMVDAMRQSGSQQWLSWGSFSYLVVVSDFKYVYKNEWEVKYSITCEVVSDGAATIFTPTLTSVIWTDVNTVTAIATVAPLAPAVPGAVTITPSMTTALASSTLALTTAGSVEDLTTPQLQPVINSFQSTYNIFAVGNGAPAGINLNAYVGNSVLDTFANFTNEANLVCNDADVQLCLGYLGRILSNLMMAGG